MTTSSTILSCILFVSIMVVLVESRAIPAEPVSLMMDAYGNPVLFVREKRTPIQTYPQRAMMFTGYYRPVRRSNNGGQASGVFAQGNAVSGEAFFGGLQSPNFKNGPEPIEEPEVSSAEAQAAPEPEEALPEHDQEIPIQNEDRYIPEDQRHDQEEHGLQANEQEINVSKPEIETPVPAEEPIAPSTEATVNNRPKASLGKKKKVPVQVEDDDEEDDVDDEDEDPVVPFVPFKGNRRHQGYPHLNNFFPMVFSFPGASTRAGSSGSPPGAVTAIANSYSTGKGGVASSVATAYGGSPNGKKRRTSPAEE
ncbi:zinc finger protein jing [Vespula maculifrons]|uniref:Zinc finger protein jing n=1 Tax=Vespula maculifrons TaxID=7453 RepID=A0ABD2BZB5_VESMC